MKAFIQLGKLATLVSWVIAIGSVWLAPSALAVDCTVPISGNMTVSSSCSFPGTTNGVDAGTGTTNSASVTVSSGATLTVSAGQTIAAGSLIPSGGSVALISGGQIKPGLPLWTYDADADGYPKESTMAAQATADAGFRRRNLMTSMTTRDCKDFYGSGITCDPSTMNMTDGTYYGAYQEASGNPAGSYRELPADNSTVGLWHMNEASGNVADSSGNGNTGTPTGTTVVAGKLGNARSFDGSNDVIDLGSGASFDFGNNGAFTHSGWVKPTTLVDYAGFVSKVVAGRGGTYSYMTVFMADGRLVAYNGAGWVNICPAGSVANGSWYYVSYVYNGTTLYGYVNGQLCGSTAFSYTDNTAHNVYIGSWYSPTTTYDYNGLIDEVRISNVARTPEEIKADAQRKPYASYIGPTNDLTQTPGSWSSLNFTAKGMKTADGETPANTTNLVAQWNFNSTSGTTATNDAGFGTCGGTAANCNGTVYNTVTSSQDFAAGTGWTANNRRWGAGALMFDGTNDYVSVPDNDLWAFGSNNFSIEAWVNIKTAVSPTLYWSIVEHRNANNSAYWNFAIHSNKQLWFTWYDGVSNPSIAAGNISNDTWHHVAVTRNGSTFTLYIDGVAAGTGTSSVAIPNIANSMFIGNMWTSHYANMTLDSTRIYSRALTASEILANYQAGNIEFQTRTSADNSTWEAWKPVTNETAIDAVDSLSPVEKISQTSLTAYWKLDETSGTRADSKGSNTLTDNNTVTYAPGRLNNAADFEASTSEYLSILDNTDLSTGDIDFSLAAWVNMESKGDSGIVGKWASNSGSDEYLIYYNNTADRFYFTVTNSSSTAGAAVANTLGSPSTGTWYFIVAWHDAAANTINIQVNNGGINSTAWTTGVRDGTQDFKIGQFPNWYWDGLIDEVAFWKRTLTAAERTRLYEDGLDLHGAGSGRIYRSRDTTTKIEGTASEKLSLGAPQVDANTIGLWHLEETNASGNGVIKDSSSSNINLSIKNTPTVTDGFFGKARNFQSADTDYLCTDTNSDGTCDDADSLDFGTGAFTISAWVKNTNNGNAQTIYSKWATTSGIVVYVLSTGVIRFYTNTTNLDSSTRIDDGKWHLVTVSRNGSATTKIYIDGVVEPTTASNALTVSNNGAATVGYNLADSLYPFNGPIDEVRMSNVARSADEIAEAYRAGRDHRLSKVLISNDLSSKTKLPFYVAADRPGTYLEATVGESAYANYEPDANTVGLWHLEEQTGSGAYIKDSSGSGNNGTPTGTTFVQGKIGKARSFNGSSDYIQITRSSALEPTSMLTVEMWVKAGTQPGTFRYPISKSYNASAASYAFYTAGTTTDLYFYTRNASSLSPAVTGVLDNNWHHVVGIDDGTKIRVYIDGMERVNGNISGSYLYNTTDLAIGKDLQAVGTTNFSGSIDEVRISNTARTADEIRQAYEIGRRTHPVTIDFVTSPSSAYTAGGTTIALTSVSGLYAGDTMIIRENVGGTENIEQKTVSSISGTTVTLSSAFSNNYSTNAKVFKWQREYFDLTGSLASQRDAITRLTLRVTNGHEGRTVWLDDFRSASYLADNTPDSFNTTTGEGTYSVAGASIGSAYNRYIQTRAIFSSWDPAASATLTSSSVEYGL